MTLTVQCHKILNEIPLSEKSYWVPYTRINSCAYFPIILRFTQRLQMNKFITFPQKCPGISLHDSSTPCSAGQRMVLDSWVRIRNVAQRSWDRGSLCNNVSTKMRIERKTSFFGQTKKLKLSPLLLYLFNWMIEWSDTIKPCQILTTIQMIWESSILE